MATQALISIVDDDRFALESLIGLVRAQGYLAAGFDSAAAFLGSDERPRTACLIADLRMPEMSGFELHLFLVAAGTPLPTILITAFPSDAIRDRVLKAGVICHLTKPFDGDALFACIAAALAQATPQEER